jgi:hypothetical protein
MFFFVGEDGELNGAQFRESLEADKKKSAIMQGAQQFKPFGTIHVRIVNAFPIGAAKFTSKGSKKCLWLTLESRLGDTKNFVNPIEFDARGEYLGDTIIVHEPL